MDTILEREQYSLLYYVSYLSFLSFFYAIYAKQYSLCVVPGSVGITSVLYWYKPDYSWRRYLDMTVTKACVIYQFTMAYSSVYAVPYYSITGLGILFYPIGVYYYSKKDYWASTYAHIALHVFANIGNIILYSGNSMPFPWETPDALS